MSTVGVTLVGTTALVEADDGVDAALNLKQAQVQTTDATQTTIASISVAEDQLVLIHALVQALRSDASEAYAAIKMAAVRRAAAGNVTLVGSVVDIAEQEDSGGAPDATLDVDTGTQTARIRVTGEAAKTFNWKVTYWYVLQ